MVLKVLNETTADDGCIISLDSCFDSLFTLAGQILGLTEKLSPVHHNWPKNDVVDG